MTQSADRAIRQAVWELAAPSLVQHDSAGCYCRELTYPTAILAQLLDRFLEQQLIEAGVATRDADGQIMVAPPLSGGGVLLAAVRNVAGELVDLVSERGTLSGAEPAVAMLADHELAESLLMAQGMLFMAHSLADVIWLRLAGVAAVLCQDIGAVTVELVRSIDRAVQHLLAGRASHEPACGERHECGQSPAETPLSTSPAPSGTCSGDGPPSDRERTTSAPPCMLQPVEAEGLAEHYHMTFPMEAAMALALVVEYRSRDAGSTARAGDAVTADAPGNSPPPACPQHSGCPAPDVAATASPFPGEAPASPPNDRGVVDRPPAGMLLVLVGWSPATGRLDCWAGLTDRLGELARAQRLLAGDLPEICLWSPDPDQREDLALLQRQGGRERWHEAVLASVEDTAHVLCSLPEEIPDVPYPEARSQYQAALMHGGDHDISISKKIYEKSFTRDVLGPLLERGQACRDPVQTLMYASLAELGQLAHRMAPLAEAELLASPAESTGGQTQRFLHVVRLLITAAKLLP